MTLSSISRCCAVTQQRLSMPSRCASSLTSGAILIASGRVPKTLITLIFFMLFFLLLRRRRGRLCLHFLLLQFLFVGGLRDLARENDA